MKLCKLKDEYLDAKANSAAAWDAAYDAAWGVIRATRYQEAARIARQRMLDEALRITLSNSVDQDMWPLIHFFESALKDEGGCNEKAIMLAIDNHLKTLNDYPTAAEVQEAFNALMLELKSLICSNHYE